MEELIRIFKIGYIDAINYINQNNKKINFKIKNELKSYIYDFGYIIGYSDYYKYNKNHL